MMLSNMRYYTIVNLTLKTTEEKLVLLGSFSNQELIIKIGLKIMDMFIILGIDAGRERFNVIKD